ncbi:DNA-binding response regulator [Sphaerochaeta halotolerans]|jgi:two-component system KDP operon response regulator KdpE|uniref:DNA-binding response regulator n=1 Tax=Sphaerochaeta halotolerans TaxID=2293840 RepID=A0A372ME40_9SPIR|nr:response regulator transcription factor [Sphaerochaeta halotolerans]MDN5334555.1 two-component system, OmpR family, operon response regulator KdpE [Sphaerochaeta sp.]RFU94032.1 DNA-binding response regulator [Sphaerochaeta halotolerans]
MQNKKEKILVVEDDGQIRKFLQFALEQVGFTVSTAGSAQDGLSQLVTGQTDLILLDLGLPDFDGLEVIRKIREWSEIPIIVISARDQDKDKISALDQGADDYLTKPFSTVELLARIRVALRHRDRLDGHKSETSATVGELTINFGKRLVYLKGEELHTTPLEYALLSFLFKNIGRVVTTKSLLQELYGISHNDDTQALRALMAGLRRKIERNPATPRYILTEIGVGYRLVDE